MAKRYKLVDPLQSGTSERVLVTDWSKCAFCQEDTSEVLHCPAESWWNTLGAGYKTISDLLVGFSRIGCLPRTMDLSRLDDGEGIEATLQQHKAKWHDSCRLWYNKTQLQHAEKRKRPTEDVTDACTKVTYSLTSLLKIDTGPLTWHGLTEREPICCLCWVPEGELCHEEV